MRPVKRIAGTPKGLLAPDKGGKTELDRAIAAQPGDPASSAMLLGEISRQAAAISYSNDFHVLAAATCLARAIARAVYLARSEPGDLQPSWQSRFGR